MQNQLHVLQAAAVAVGNGTAVSVKQPQNYAFATLLLQVEGITSATITVEGTLDNDTWYTLSVISQAGTPATSITADGLYWVHVSGLYAARARISTWVSGTITVTGGLSEADSELYRTDVVASGTVAVSSIAAGNNNIGDVDVASIAAGDNNIGNVDIVTLPALPAGTNNIGDVDVLTLPALPAGTNNIGDVDVLTLPALPAGTNNIGDVDVLTLPALPAGTNSIGGTTDNGPHWTTVFGVSGAAVVSADASTATAVTDAPTAGQKLVITDIHFSVGSVAQTVEFEIETAGTIYFTVYCAANTAYQITPRSKLKLATADKKLMVDTSAAGAISVTVFYYSEV